MKKKPSSLPLRMRRTGNSLVPATKLAESMLSSVPNGGECEVTIRRRRNLAHNGKYWAILHAVIASGASVKYPTAYKLHQALLFGLNYVTPLTTLKNEVVLVPDSTAFDALDQIHFAEYYQAAMALLGQLLGRDPEELLQEAA